jgi:hypothetical protein
MVADRLWNPWADIIGTDEFSCRCLRYHVSPRSKDSIIQRWPSDPSHQFVKLNLCSPNPALGVAMVASS